MRIRKNAAKILSSLRVPTQPPSGAAAAATASSAVGRELDLHVCRLNQSPWDAMDFAAPATTVEFRDYYQELEEHVEEKLQAWIGRVDEEEGAAAGSAVNGVAAAQSTGRHRVKAVEIAGVATEDKATTATTNKKKKKKQEEEEENYVDCCDKTKKASAKSTSSIWAAAGVDEDMEVGDADTALISTCKKRGILEGRQCKREASGHQALCEYHQLGACYGNGDREARRRRHQLQSFNTTEEGDLGAKNTAALLQNKGKKTKRTWKKGCGSEGDKSAKSGGNGRRGRSKPTTPSDFYYYYSGFDPCWGKRSRGGGPAGAGQPGTGTAADQNDGDAAASPMVHDQAPEDLDEDDEDMDGVDGPAATGGRRRGRKPVKARSLKSLM